MLLVHGAWHGAWCWERVVAGLHAGGVRAHVVDLPFTGLADDADAVARALAQISAPVVVCGHSYGGRVVSAAIRDRSRVRHLVYVAAAMLTPGQQAAYDEARSSSPPLAFEDFTLAALRERFYAECEPAEVEAACARLRPMAVRPDPTLGLANRPWEAISSTYVVCARDRSVFTPALQRAMARNATHSVELETDHSPFLSRPDELVELLVRIARSGSPVAQADPAPQAKTLLRAS